MRSIVDNYVSHRCQLKRIINISMFQNFVQVGGRKYILGNFQA